MNTQLPQQNNQTREQFITSLFKLLPPDNLHIGARDRLFAGLHKGYQAIKMAYGPIGANAIIEDYRMPGHQIINDGKKILEAITLTDPVENIGLNILKEVANKSDHESGDGRKTSVILTGAILEEGMNATEAPMEIKRSLDACLPLLEEYLKTQTKLINPLQVGKIAASAAESTQLGELFQEIYTQIGSDGIIEIDNSSLPTTSYSISEGVKLIGCGFMYPYMANEDKGRKAVFNNPKVLISKQKITPQNLEGIVKALYSKGIYELVIFCDEIDPKASEALAYLWAGTLPTGQPTQNFKALVIKAPILWKDWLFEDFAKITGAKIVDPTQGLNLKQLQISHLGDCEKIITSKEETIVLGIKDIQDHLKVLADLNTDDARLRLARLKTNTAVLKLGAQSESALSHLHGKAVDARNSSYMALQHGVVPGGGSVLAHAIEVLPDTIGGNILKKALLEPQKCIMENAGSKKRISKGKGFDALSGDVVDMYEAGILDASVVVTNALKNAISVAGMILTSKVVITLNK